MLHGINSIFPPTKVTGHCGEEPISKKKLEEDEGMFDTRKEILGWMFDGQQFTMELTDKKRATILQEINTILKAKKSTAKQLEKLQGKLVHVATGIPGGKGLLSPLYKTVATAKEWITINKDTKQCLSDWKTIIREVAARPTSVLELVPRLPHTIGYVDASGSAAGGVWTSGTQQLQTPIVWRFQWPPEIQQNLVSANNPQGTISINDLELAGVLLAWLVLEKITKLYICPHRTIL